MIVRSTLLAAIAGLAMHAARAATPPPPPPKEVDAELLEFLGSLDEEESGWQEYLEQKPVKPPENQPAKQPEKAAPPRRATDPKQVKDK
ncbi:MAG: hypothetical protein ABIP38_00435 [Steroidobacteraceae bacterium]